MSPSLRARLGNKHVFVLLVGVTAGPLLVVLAAATSPYTALALIAGAAAAVPILSWPPSTILLTAAVVPLERLGRFSNDAQVVTFSLMRLMGALALATLAIHWCIGRRRLKFTKPFLFYAAYILIAMVSLYGTTDLIKGVQQCSTMVGNALFLLLIMHVVTRKEQVRAPAILWLATTLAVGVFCIYQWHSPSAEVHIDRFDNSGQRTTEERFSTVMEDYGEFETIGVVRRLLGPTSSPSVYGINIILALPFYIYLARTTLSIWMRIFCGAGLVIGCYNVILTNTRAAFVTLVVAGICMAATRLVRLRPVDIVVAVIATAVLVPFLPSALYSRIFQASNYTVDRSATLRIRFLYWQTAVDMFADHWLLGCGIGNQNELPSRLQNIAMPANTTVHNEYLETLLETGIVGYPVMAAFVIVVYRRCRRAERIFTAQGDAATALFLNAARVGFFAVLFYALQCDVLHFTLKGWWLSMGLCLALAEIAAAGAAQPQRQEAGA
jgi:hypothetical protein